MGDMHKFNAIVIMSALTAGTLLLAIALVIGNTSIQPASAQLPDENGASTFAPIGKEPPVAGGWMPMERPPTCEGCAEDNPGQQGIDAGVIGPPKKIP